MIRALAPAWRWTWSDPVSKMPIDLFELRTRHTITGCLYVPGDRYSVSDLPNLLRSWPDVPNHTLYLDAREDGVLCLDVEPKCPDEIKARLIRMPYIYGEYSLSGKGWHLFFPVPRGVMAKYPAAQKKTILKEPHGWYEVLLVHAVTFTRNAFARSDGTEPFEPVMESLCAKAVERTFRDFAVTTEKPDLPKYDQIRFYMDRRLHKYPKTPDDFGSMSEYEYGYQGFLYHGLSRLLATRGFSDVDYDANRRMWLLYLMSVDAIPYRPKHDQLHDGLPTLMYNAKRIVGSETKKNGARVENGTKKPNEKE